MTINALNDSILSNPNLNDFRLNSEQIERFIEDWMRTGDFPEGTCVVKITGSSHASIQEHLSQAEVPEPEKVIAQKLIDANSHQSFGLKFLLNNSKNIQLNEHILSEVFTAIARIGSKPLLQIQQPLTFVDGGSQTEEQVLAANMQIEAKNEVSKQTNDETIKLQSRVSWSVPAVKHAKPESYEGDWEYPVDPSDYAFWKEKCYIKV